MKMTVIEIEDYNGNTVMAFRVSKELSHGDFEQFQDCNVADEDGDYIFGTQDNLIRIQSTKE